MTTLSEKDLESCAREPIHRPGSIQPHGALLLLASGDFGLRAASENASAMLGVALTAGEPPGGSIAALLGPLREWIASDEGSFQDIVAIGGRAFHAVAHRAEAGIILEFELLPAGEDRPMERLFPRLKALAEKLSALPDARALSALTARYVRDLTGFDRVLVYRFDRDWNGHVVGEDGNGVLPSYLDLRFPAGDIPAQARQLYKLNRLRIIPDVDYTPVPVRPMPGLPDGGEPLDMSFAVLRSVSPVHLEYMRNMGTASSMSVSILVDGELWGLVACHGRAPHHVSLTIRNICDFAVQSFATEIAARQRAAEAATRVELGGVLARLLARMTASPDWRRGLAAHEDELLAQVNATGAALVGEDYLQTAGRTPAPDQIQAIVECLERQGGTEPFASDNLAAIMPEAADFADVGSGLLAVRISELHPSWLLWFRPEVVRTVTWGGDPHKFVREQGDIHPRRSFESWKELVRQHSTPWRPAEIAAAYDLRAAIIGIVLRRAEELAQLTVELQRSNKELEAFSYSVSHDLRAPFRHVVGYSELLRERERDLDDTSRHYLSCIIDSALSAGRLVDDLLNFSHIGRTALAARDMDMNKLVAEVRQSLALQAKDRSVAWEVGSLPPAWGDSTLMRQVWFNLVENALKYTRPRNPAVIAVSGRVDGREMIYTVEDNGVGFNMRYVDKLFGVFQRLQRAEDFEGTGIGLALARRIVERHGGRIWAEGEIDRGACFHFALPMKDITGNHG